MAFKTFLLTSFSFDGTAINTKATATIDETSTVNTHSADSSRTVNLVTVDNKGVSISIEVFDQSLGTGKRPGTAGALVLVGKERAAGDAFVSASSVTITIAKAVITGYTNNFQTEGEGSITISFEAYDDQADDATEDTLIVYS